MVRSKDPVHRGHRAEVGALVEQRRPGLCDGLVDEPVTGQDAQHRRPLGFGEGVDRAWTWPRRSRSNRPTRPVVAGAGAAQQRTRRYDPDVLGEVVDGGVDHLLDRLSVSALSESVSKSALTFPMRSNAALLRANSASALAARAVNASI